MRQQVQSHLLQTARSARPRPPNQATQPQSRFHGLEWYQRDRHFALGVTSGLRDATGFKQRGGASDMPLAFDTGASLRYAF